MTAIRVGPRQEADLVHITNQEIPVATLQDYDRFTIGTAAGSVDTWDISHLDEVHISVDSNGTTDTIAVYISHDGVNFDTAHPVMLTSWSGGTPAVSATPIAATILEEGTGTIPFNGKKLRFDKTGTTDILTVSWSARNSGRGSV